MEDPVAEIPEIVHALTTSPPCVQREAIETYFLPSAAFDHPLVLIDPFTSPLPSRSIILSVYRCYKILSPEIEVQVLSVAFDEPNGQLYVTAQQVLAFWFFPWARIPARLVTVLSLSKQRHPGAHPYSAHVPEKWYIKSQTDLYQSDQWVGCLPVVGIPARAAVLFAKRMAAVACWALAAVFLWIGLLADRVGGKRVGSTQGQREDRALELVEGVERTVSKKLR
ncbi:hypothetical protein FN846DRAFT_961907 [Sphaerosporella brunnea]|uniref:SigF-like NTF2-like domain-containing protein n=1 Tax=Sphaerosporella brunnea TaxID=1250544 RepID=A0A5J5EPF4_9PEZI|nr:hypothetical protein FN846DRAFT_961907 [Sphaerosporella brunnea]